MGTLMTGKLQSMGFFPPAPFCNICARTIQHFVFQHPFIYATAEVKLSLGTPSVKETCLAEFIACLQLQL